MTRFCDWYVHLYVCVCGPHACHLTPYFCAPSPSIQSVCVCVCVRARFILSTHSVFSTKPAHQRFFLPVSFQVVIRTLKRVSAIPYFSSLSLVWTTVRVGQLFYCLCACMCVCLSNCTIFTACVCLCMCVCCMCVYVCACVCVYMCVGV